MARTSTAVVRALGAGETTFRPPVGRAIGVEERVLLLDTEPRDEVLSQVHDLLGVVTVVGPVGGAIVVVALGEDKDVVAAAEGVLEDGGRAEVDVGVMARGLVRGGTVEVPNTELPDVGHLLGDGLCIVESEDERAPLRTVHLPWSWNGDHRRRQSRRLRAKVSHSESMSPVKPRKHTLSLDFVTLGEGEVRCQQVGTVGHV